MRALPALALVLVLAACGGPRLEVVDAVSGAPVAARVQPVASGLLVEADGYETRIVQPGGRVELRPLWEERFMSPGERPPPRPERSGKPCCPDQRVQ